MDGNSGGELGHVSCSSSPLDFNWTVRKQVKRFQNLPPPSVESSLFATRKLDAPDQSTRHLVPARPQMPDRAWSWPKKGCLPSPPAYTAPSARSTVQRMRRRTGGAATPQAGNASPSQLPPRPHTLQSTPASGLADRVAIGR